MTLDDLIHPKDASGASGSYSYRRVEQQPPSAYLGRQAAPR